MIYTDEARHTFSRDGAFIYRIENGLRLLDQMLVHNAYFTAIMWKLRKGRVISSVSATASVNEGKPKHETK